MPGGPSCSKNAACGLTAGTNGATTSITPRQNRANASACVGQRGIVPAGQQPLRQHRSPRVEAHQHRVSAPPHRRSQSIRETEHATTSFVRRKVVWFLAPRRPILIVFPEQCEAPAYLPGPLHNPPAMASGTHGVTSAAKPARTASRAIASRRRICDTPKLPLGGSAPGHSPRFSACHPPPGRGAAWLARLTGGQKVAGSNPVAPTCKAFRSNELRKAFLIGEDSEKIAGLRRGYHREKCR